jgi:hypothetical protein
MLTPVLPLSANRRTLGHIIATWIGLSQNLFKMSDSESIIWRPHGRIVADRFHVIRTVNQHFLAC